MKKFIIEDLNIKSFWASWSGPAIHLKWNILLMFNRPLWAKISDEVVVSSLDGLLSDVDAFNPVRIVELRIDLILSSVLRMNASEIRGAPHLIGVELIGAFVLVPIAGWRIINAIEEAVTGLETKLAVELGTMEVSHKEEPVVSETHFLVFLYIIY